MNRTKVLVVLLGLLLTTVALSQSFAAPTSLEEASAKIEEGLLEQAEAEGSAAYLVYLNAEADLSAAYDIDDWSERGAYVVDTLQATAKRSQAGLLRFLDAQKAAGAVSHIQPFFIDNVVLVNSDAATISSVAARPEVVSIRGENIFTIPEPRRDDNGIAALEWGVELVNADDVWNDFGTMGEGVVVANIDTGADTDHPALQNSYRGWNGSSYDHDYNFYDPAGVCGGSPCDNNDHGSHTMGTMVGDDGGTNQIGVAPGATWIAAKGCESNFCSEASLLGSAEWLLAPCEFGDAPGAPSCSSDERPHLINNSWGGGGGDPWYQASVDAWLAADIFPIFSAGNSGPGAGTIGTPGDYCNVLGVGATDINDSVAGFSSRGPGNFSECLDKPDVSAPGAGVRSSVDGGGYASFSGTSMAAPHVAGCLALMRSVDPAMSFEDMYDILISTGVDLGDTGFDNNYGYGRLDCYEAASQLTPDFRLSADPAAGAVCIGDTFNSTISVLGIAGFGDAVSLSDNWQGSLSPSVVTPPGTSAYVLDTTSAPGAGDYTVKITGSSTTPSKVLDIPMSLYDAAPGAAMLQMPSNGASDVALAPTLTWTGGAQSATYDVAIATDAAFTDIVAFALNIEDTSWTANVALDPVSTYYWVVRASNPCDMMTLSSVYSFTTREIPPVLLVDDDDNNPDVRASYETALMASGIDYDVWDTNNSDNEPSAAELAGYELIVWETGDEFGGAAGPGDAGEAALAQYLDGGGCLFISSQDYYYDRGLTDFMTSHLGLGSATSDVSQTSVTGTVPMFGDTYSLSYPFTNYSDVISPSGSGTLLFEGNQGDAGIYSLGAGYATSFWGFPLEAMTATDQAESLRKVYRACVFFMETGLDGFAQEFDLD